MGSGHHRLFEVGLSILALAGGILWVGTNPYRQSLALDFILLGVIALAMYAPFIMGGVISLAYGAYVAVGAYSVALVSSHTGWPLVAAIPIGMGISVVLASILAAATSRLSGFYLAAITLIFADAFQAWLTSNVSVTGGEAGITGFRPFTLGITFSQNEIVWIALGVVWLIALLLSNLRRSSFGIALRARRQVPVAVEAVGISVFVVTMVAQLLGAALASLGGSIYTIQSGSVLPTSFPVDLVIIALFAPLLGGIESPWGALVGCALVVELTYNLNIFSSTGTLFFALAVILVLVVAPKGILGYRPNIPNTVSHVLRRISGFGGDTN